MAKETSHSYGGENEDENERLRICCLIRHNQRSCRTRRRSRGERRGPGSLPGHVNCYKAGAAGGEGEGLDHHLPSLLVQRHQLVIHVLLPTDSPKSPPPIKLSSIAAVALFSAGCHPYHLGQRNSSVAVSNTKWPQILNTKISSTLGRPASCG